MADAHDDIDNENEILAATKRVAAQRAAAEEAEARRTAKDGTGKWPVVPLAAAGIGSAALAAAVLWSRRDKGKKD